MTMLLFVGMFPMYRENQKGKGTEVQTMKKKGTEQSMMMGPSSHHHNDSNTDMKGLTLFATNSNLSTSSNTLHQNYEPQIRPCQEQPYLNEIPDSLSVTYRPIQMHIKMLIGITSLFISTLYTFGIKSFFSTLQTFFKIMFSNTSLLLQPSPFTYWSRIHKKAILQFLSTSFLISLLSTITIQEWFYTPSRIATTELFNKQWLPSSLSMYKTVTTTIPHTLSIGNEQQNPSKYQSYGPLGIHYLFYNTKPSSSKLLPKNDNNNSFIGQQLQQQLKKKYDAIYFNHGFGASSLSWLPAIPNLVDRLGGQFGLAHDAPGFGFTDRPTSTSTASNTKFKLTTKNDYLNMYTSIGSASFATNLLLDTMQSSKAKKLESSPSFISSVGYDETQSYQPIVSTISLSKEDAEKSKEGVCMDDSNSAIHDNSKHIILFGHSMGCSTTLHMAKMLPKNITKTVILVAPALLGSFSKVVENELSSTSLKLNDTKRRNQAALKIRKIVSTIVNSQPTVFLNNFINLFISSLRKVLFDIPLEFTLRRLVSMPNFWKRGLSSAWGNMHTLKRSDILRFTWPGIAKGWEKGLLAFTRSRLGSTNELDLLRDVVQDTETRVILIQGTNDKVIPSSMTKKIAQYFNLTLIELQGLGHDPFEEDVDLFVSTVEKCIL